MTAPAPECVTLARDLREVRSRTGLSLVALAERTAYSKSSWERYLNARKPVPWEAVQALCAIAAEPTGRLRALWELADAQWSARGAARPPTHAPAPAAGSEVPPPGTAGRARLPRIAAAGAGAVAVAAAAVVMVAVAHGPDAAVRQQAPVATTALDPPAGCHGKACDGRDPDLMSCGLPGRADTLGPTRRTAGGAGVEIRYSRVCTAAWGRVWHARVGDTIEVSAPGARPRRVVIKDPADTGRYRFTPMIGGADRTGLELCFLPADGGSRECFHS